MVKEKGYYGVFLFASTLLVGLWGTKLYSYLLFYSIAEIFSVVVACGIFMLAWNSRQFTRNNYLLFIGIAYLFVSVIDLTHTFAYKGMDIFRNENTNLPTQLWIAARYIQSISLLIAPLFIGRKLKTNFVFLGYIIATVILLGSILYWHVFPICFIEGEGFTIFKKASEYVISFILLTSVVVLLKKRKEFEPDILRLLIASVVITIASELVFTLYVDAYGFSNLVGHYLKIVSFYLIYKAVLETALKRPYTLLFRDISQKERALSKEKDRLAREADESFVKLRNAELKYKTIADFTYDWEYWESPEGTYHYVSPSCERITGYKPEEFMKNPQILQKLIFSEDKVRWNEHRQEAFNNKGLHEIQFRIRKQDGQIRWIEHVCQPVTDGKGKFFGFRASNRDITDRKQSEEELKQSKEDLARAQEIFHVGSWRFDIVKNELCWSDEVYRMFALSSSLPMSYEKFITFIYSGDEAHVKERWLAALNGESYDIDYRIVVDDTMKWVRQQAEVIFDEADNVISMVGTVQDITGRKWSEEEIHRLRDESTHIARVSAMGELVASLAHELKQPLAAIRSNAQAAQRFLTGSKPDIDELHEVLKDIIKDNRRADDIIRKLRAMMRKSELKITQFNINDIVQETFLLIKRYETIRNISLELELDKNIPHVSGDQIQLQQVILNFILNSTEALMNTEMDSGAIVVSTNQKHTGNATISVKDNGPGISEKDMGHLFEPFYTTKKEGLGMGLAISRTIIEEHGGQLWAENNPDSGATFYFTIPIAKGDLS